MAAVVLIYSFGESAPQGFGGGEGRAPAAAERRAAAAAPGSEAGAVLQPEVPAERAHQNGNHK